MTRQLVQKVRATNIRLGRGQVRSVAVSSLVLSLDTLLDRVLPDPAYELGGSDQFFGRVVWHPALPDRDRYSLQQAMLLTLRPLKQTRSTVFTVR